MRLDSCEKKALKFALQGFRGQAYLFGSRLDDRGRGGDIDLLLMPKSKVNRLSLVLRTQTRFFSKCEEKIDVVVYDDNSLFCREVIKDAKRINPK